MMKHLPNLSNRWKAHAWGASLLAVSLWSTVPFTSPASAQTLLRINSDTSSFENLELIHGDVAVRASYRHYQELQESDDNNLSYQLLYQGEDQGAVVDTLAWIFAEFELQDLDSDGTIEVIVRNFSGGGPLLHQHHHSSLGWQWLCCHRNWLYGWRRAAIRGF